MHSMSTTLSILLYPLGYPTSQVTLRKSLCNRYQKVIDTPKRVRVIFVLWERVPPKQEGKIVCDKCHINPSRFEVSGATFRIGLVSQVCTSCAHDICLDNGDIAGAKFFAQLAFAS